TVQGRHLLLAVLDEVDRQAHDLVAPHFDLPDHELSRDHVAPPSVAEELDAGRVAAERESLGATVFAHVQEPIAGTAEIQGPTAGAADGGRDAAGDHLDSYLIAAVRVSLPLSDEVALAADGAEVGNCAAAARWLDELAVGQRFEARPRNTVDIEREAESLQLF